jgi:cyclopropane fatty-acyl-phospholipid synthase-like methyltransferase
VYLTDQTATNTVGALHFTLLGQSFARLTFSPPPVLTISFSTYKGEPFYQSIARHEHYLAAQMGLKPGMRVLDVGCGVGGPAREIARFTDVNIVGINNNDYQVERARRYTDKAGLADQVEFIKGDFMKLSETFGEASFDAVYAIEATVHAPSFEGVYGEILKVLKPGGTVRVQSSPLAYVLLILIWAEKQHSLVSTNGS